MAFPLAFHLQNKVIFYIFVFCSTHPSCSTCNSIFFSNGTQIPATSPYFTAKGHWEKILNIPIPSSRIFFQASSCISIESSMTVEYFYYFEGSENVNPPNKLKETVMERAASLSLLWSKPVIPAASPSSVPPNSKAFRTFGSIHRVRACRCARTRQGQSSHRITRVNHFLSSR